ncbi:MAG: TetR family transcriptional regulator [Spirillospora sp.]
MTSPDPRARDRGDGSAPPLRKGDRTRLRILEAARRQFGRHGYELATIRGIAADANVDKASVMKHFGSKQDLFRAAVHWSIPIDELTTDDPGRSAENYLTSMLAGWAAIPDHPMSVLLRASMTSEDAAGMLTGHLTAEVVDRVAASLDGPDARLRAALFASFMTGLVSQRHMLRLPDLADADVDDVIRIAAPAVQALLGSVSGQASG